MEKFIEKLTIFMVCLVSILFVVLILSWPFQLLWNWLMPMIFGLPKITLLQALGLLILSNLMYKTNIKTKKKKKKYFCIFKT